MDPCKEIFVDDLFVFESGDLMFAIVSFLVDLILLGPDEGAFVHVGMDLDIGIVAQLQSILAERVNMTPPKM
jgi:hypothetical protein